MKRLAYELGKNKWWKRLENDTSGKPRTVHVILYMRRWHWGKNERERERQRPAEGELAASHSYLMISYIVRAMNFKEHMFFEVM